MEILVEQTQARVPITIFRMAGRINLGNTEQWEAKCREVYEQGARDLLLDLKNVPSMTSAGFRTLQIIYKLFESNDASERSSGKSAHFKLLQPSAEVARVLKLVGFEVYIDIYDDEQAALNAF